MPESLSAFCRMVSGKTKIFGVRVPQEDAQVIGGSAPLTAAKTSRMLDVSVACVRLCAQGFSCTVQSSSI